MTRHLIFLILTTFCLIVFNSCGNDEPIVRQQYEAVDLGLSVKWANMNLGATAPQNYGRLIGWADSSGVHTTFDGIFLSYQYINSVLHTNCTWNSPYYGGNTPLSNIAGTDYDPARYIWNTNWRIPTREQWQELIDRCSWKLETIEGNQVLRATGPNGNSIILPLSGINTTGAEGTHEYRDLMAFYWSANLLPASQQADYHINATRPVAAWAMQFNSDADTRPAMQPQIRCYRLPVRAVQNNP